MSSRRLRRVRVCSCAQHDSIDFWDEKLGNQSIEVPGGCEKAMRAVGNFDMAVDLIEGDSPAVGKNGTEWVDYQFLNNSLSIIEAHDASKPLFLLHSFHSIHAPLNAPAELYTGEYAPPPCTGKDAMRTCFKRFGAFTHDDRRSYAAMITFTDGAIGQIKDALQVGLARTRTSAHSRTRSPVAPLAPAR